MSIHEGIFHGNLWKQYSASLLTNCTTIAPMLTKELSQLASSAVNMCTMSHLLPQPVMWGLAGEVHAIAFPITKEPIAAVIFNSEY